MVASLNTAKLIKNDENQIKVQFTVDGTVANSIKSTNFEGVTLRKSEAKTAVEQPVKTPEQNIEQQIDIKADNITTPIDQKPKQVEAPKQNQISEDKTAKKEPSVMEQVIAKAEAGKTTNQGPSELELKENNPVETKLTNKIVEEEAPKAPETSAQTTEQKSSINPEALASLKEKLDSITQKMEGAKTVVSPAEVQNSEIAELESETEAAQALANLNSKSSLVDEVATPMTSFDFNVMEEKKMSGQSVG